MHVYGHNHIIGFHLSINEMATKIETGFNVLGSLPFIGAVSGLLRIVAGKIQIVASAVLVLVGIIGAAVSRAPHARFRFRQMRELGKEHVIHGLLNIIRGAVEFFAGTSFAGTSLRGFGSLFMLIPNLSQDRMFSPAYKYN